MKSFLVLVLSSLSVQAFSSVTLLTINKAHPLIRCEITKDSAKLTRTIQGIKFSKQISYQIDDLLTLIDKAYESQISSPVNESEYEALYASGTDKAANFKLNIEEPNAKKLINFMSAICEVKSL